MYKKGDIFGQKGVIPKQYIQSKFQIRKKSPEEEIVKQNSRAPTPESIKNDLQKIIKNQDYIGDNDVRVKTKDRMQKFQSDFEMKMERMNYYLQKELEGQVTKFKKKPKRKKSIFE